MSSQGTPESYSILLDNIIKIRLKYLVTLTLTFLIAPSLLISKFAISRFLFVYLASSAYAVAIIAQRFVFLRQSINYNNNDLKFFNWNNVFGVSVSTLFTYALNTSFSLIFFIIIGNAFFQSHLNFLNEPKKHQLPTVNQQFIYYHIYAISVGLFNSLYSYSFNENLINFDYNRFYSTSKSLLKSYINADSYIKLTYSYTLRLFVFIISFAAFFYFANVHQFASNWLSIIFNISTSTGNDHLGFNLLFNAKLVFFGVLLKLITYTVSFSFFNSYILLGGLHFNQLISTYSNNKSDAINFPLLFNTLKESKDQLAKITVLQELEYLASSKKPAFFNNVIAYYGDFSKSVEAIAKTNVEKLDVKLKTQQANNKAKAEKTTTEEKLKLKKKQDEADPNKAEIKNVDVFQKNKLSFFWSTLDSISLKFLILIQDKEASESVYVTNFVKRQLCLLSGFIDYARANILYSLNINTLENNFELAEAISFYYHLSTLTQIIRNSYVNNKFHNRILSNIDQILALLQKLIKFCEDYINFNNIDKNISIEEAKFKYYNVQSNQYTNPFLVIKLRKILMDCFFDLITKYNDILGELNLSKEVLSLSKQYLNDFNSKKSNRTKRVPTSSGADNSRSEFTTFDINVNY